MVTLPEKEKQPMRPKFRSLPVCFALLACVFHAMPARSQTGQPSSGERLAGSWMGFYQSAVMAEDHGDLLLRILGTSHRRFGGSLQAIGHEVGHWNVEHLLLDATLSSSGNIAFMGEESAFGKLAGHGQASELGGTLLATSRYRLRMADGLMDDGYIALLKAFPDAAPGPQGTWAGFLISEGGSREPLTVEFPRLSDASADVASAVICWIQVTTDASGRLAVLGQGLDGNILIGDGSVIPAEGDRPSMTVADYRLFNPLRGMPHQWGDFAAFGAVMFDQGTLFLLPAVQ
jgi:hypothetical protein